MEKFLNGVKHLDMDSSNYSSRYHHFVFLRFINTMQRAFVGILSENRAEYFITDWVRFSFQFVVLILNIDLYFIFLC